MKKTFILSALFLAFPFILFAQKAVIDSTIASLLNTIDVEQSTSIKMHSCGKRRYRVNYQFFGKVKNERAIVRITKAGVKVEKIEYKDLMQYIRVVKINDKVFAFTWEKYVTTPEQLRLLENRGFKNVNLKQTTLSYIKDKILIEDFFPEHEEVIPSRYYYY